MNFKKFILKKFDKKILTKSIKYYYNHKRNKKCNYFLGFNNRKIFCLKWLIG